MNRKIGVQLIVFISLFLLLSSTLSSTVKSIPPVTQETIIVDIAGNGDYTSINDAIKNASITDIILIKKGMYNEHDITIKNKIEIIGESPSNTIINCSGNQAFSLTSSYVDISNIQIINTGEFAVSIPPGSIGCTITNCIINTANKGVALNVRSSYNTISDCKLIGYQTSKQGVKITGKYNIITNCDMQDFTNGVLLITNSDNNQILNCNIFNCENAIDIRFDSNRNVISGCNIYSNLQTVKIWLNSNDNYVYLNNFWKNDVDAIDENNNTWDNGAKGNYWDKYRGNDINGDGKGDTPYVISKGNIDRYPLMTMNLPDVILPPANLIITSSKSDKTPSFSWSETVYSIGIKGYFVKLDNRPEAFIGDKTSWTTGISLSDGVHTFYVRAESIDNKSSNYSSITFTIDTSIIDTDGDGWSDSEEKLYGTDPDNPINYPEDTDKDHVPNQIDTDDDNDGYSDEMELSYATNTLDVNDHPLDTDKDGVPNDDSSDNKYIGDLDDDNDGLTDVIEASLGSSSINELDVKRLYISGQIFYLIDASQNGVFDVLYNPITTVTTGVERQNDNYLIDKNGDGSWDHLYNTIDGSVSTYSEEIPLPIITFIIVLVVFIIASIVIYTYLKRKPIKLIKTEQKREIPKISAIEKSVIPSAFDKKGTIQMITQTKSLLQHIQQDVEVYMEKLRRIEDQFIEPVSKEVGTYDETAVEKKKKSEIDEKVDELLSKFDNK
ncbi:hypothetical protein AYK20_07615 [Thermoplasmatales archaeon SG8-52-1]|nr:MAG: hypothetical protein AYK20_07615 [Thermoplasmatales archaeon SG8-52-1]